MSSDAATALFAAIHAGNLEGVRILVEAEPELLSALSPSRLSPVLFAAYYQRPDILRHLIEAGAALNIFEAAASGQAGRTRELLDENPLLVNAVSPDGFSPLGLAAFFGHADVASELLARGANVNAVSENAMQVQPLHSAVAGNHALLAEALVEAGAEVNAVQQDGFTPLMGAAQHGNAGLVAFLLSHGANALAQTSDGSTAASLASEEKHESVLNVLGVQTDQPEENANASLAALAQTELMSDKEILGQTGAVTGFDTPDPKEGDPDAIYTTTPPDDQVGSADQSHYQAVEIPPAKAVTGPFDHLATRDVAAMEHTPQPPEFAGAESVASLGATPGALDAAALSAGTGVPLSQAVVQQHIEAVSDQNPRYTPPSQMTPPHLSQRPADLPAGETPEIQEEVQRNKR